MLTIFLNNGIIINKNKTAIIKQSKMLNNWYQKIYTKNIVKKEVQERSQLK